MENRLAEEIPKMNIKGFRFRGARFYLQGIQLGAVAHEIVVLIDVGSLPVHTTKAVPPQIQKKGEWPLDPGTETFPHSSMNDDAGEAFIVQRKVTPTQAVAESLGDLALQPGNIRKFRQDHYRKIRQFVIF
jgi:hypothetical protein